MSVQTNDELTIEEVAEYAEERGFSLLMRGEVFALSRGVRTIAVGTLEELVEVLEVSEEFDDLVERLAPEDITLH